MIRGFEGYYEPDFDALWKEGVFVFDANVLLDLFRYSAGARKELLDVLEGLGDRIWIPHQFLLEYHSHKATIYDDIKNEYDASEKQLEVCFSAIRELVEKLRGLRNRTGVEIDSRQETLEKVLEEVKNKATDAKSEHLESVQKEPIEESIAALFGERHGDGYDQSRLHELHKEAKRRLDNGIPPCSTKDQKKDSGHRHGDYIGWKQILDFAKKDKTSIIFVANDRDWYEEYKGKTKGPHTVLLQELYDEAGVRCYIYRTSEFIKYARRFLDAQVSDQTIVEADNLESDAFDQWLPPEIGRDSSHEYRRSLTSLRQIRPGVILRQANMVSESFVGEELEHPDFQEANLMGANFRRAVIWGANFRAANLQCVNFARARLTHSDFSHADLRGATLTGALLHGALFNGAILPDGNAFEADPDTARFTEQQHRRFRRTQKRVQQLRLKLECD